MNRKLDAILVNCNDKKLSNLFKRQRFFSLQKIEEEAEEHYE